MDGVLDWVEARRDEIDHNNLGAGFPMLEHIGVHPTEVSRQLWALLGPLVAVDPSLHSVFANVPRHNGLEAWRRIAEPINEDKILILKDLLPAVTNPRPATSLDDLSTALEAWDTNLRLFSAAGGVPPSSEQKRLSFVAMSPQTSRPTSRCTWNSRSTRPTLL